MDGGGWLLLRTGEAFRWKDYMSLLIKHFDKDNFKEKTSCAFQKNLKAAPSPEEKSRVKKLYSFQVLEPEDTVQTGEYATYEVYFEPSTISLQLELVPKFRRSADLRNVEVDLCCSSN